MQRSLRLWMVMGVVAGGLSAARGASRVDELVAMLAGGDEKARSEARQLLPRESVQAVSSLLPLLGHENPSVWCAAFNVPADFANVVSVPGREADRTAVTAGLMTPVAQDQPEHIKIRGLRPLPLVVPKGHDVGPIAALLADASLREKARAALQAIETPEACAALRAALDKAEPDFACALLTSPGECKDAESIPAVAKLAGHKDQRVRAAAARALSWTGDAAGGGGGWNFCLRITKPDGSVLQTR